MASKDEREFDSGLTGGTDVPASEEDFSLEEILAEYGAGREQRLMEAVEQEARRETEPAAPPAEGGAEEPPLQTEARLRPAPGRRRKRPRPQSRPPGRRTRWRSCGRIYRPLPTPSRWRMWWAAPWTR